VFDKFPKSHMIIVLRDLIDQKVSENIFTPKLEVNVNTKLVMIMELE
jgi:hypothetical protein